MGKCEIQEFLEEHLILHTSVLLRRQNTCTEHSWKGKNRTIPSLFIPHLFHGRKNDSRNETDLIVSQHRVNQGFLTLTLDT